MVFLIRGIWHEHINLILIAIQQSKNYFYVHYVKKKLRYYELSNLPMVA